MSLPEVLAVLVYVLGCFTTIVAFPAVVVYGPRWAIGLFSVGVAMVGFGFLALVALS